MSIPIASHAITIINTIVDGTIMGIGITIMGIGITIMGMAISMIAMDDRRQDLHHVRRGAGTSSDERAAVIPFHDREQQPRASAANGVLRRPWNLGR
jgi:hypothetical protein